MAKKRKPKSPASFAAEPSSAASSNDGGRRENSRPPEKKKNGVVVVGGGGGGCDRGGDSDDDSSSSSSSSDDDSLVLEGVLMRNPDASESSDSGSDDEVSSEEEEEEGPTKKKADGPDREIASTSKTDANGGDGNSAIARETKSQQRRNKEKLKRKQPSEPEMIHVEFLFCDVQERFFHGMKTLLHRQSFHAEHSSQLADLIIDNETIGTVLSTDLDPSDGPTDSGAAGKKNKSPSNGSAAASPPAAQEGEANVFGFASVVNVTANRSSPCVQSLKRLCLDNCPPERRAEMETVLSGRTKRPAGFFFHERMINVPLDITLVLHQQLVLDMDHALENASDEDERKSLDYGAFVRMAPCFRSDERGCGHGVVVYKYFDDEVFATNAEFVYNFKAPKARDRADAEDDEFWCSVIVLTKTGHREAMNDLKKMIQGG
jgi:hypothetical protein